LTKDFNKLKKDWSQISDIKKYCFVYNDKNIGSTQKLELAITELEKDNPDIEFEIFNSKKLEATFFTLDSSEILNLGFHIDSRTAIENAYEYIKRIEIALDKEYANYALKLHSEIENIISTLGDEQLEHEYELLKGRCLQKIERVQEAKLIYINLSKRQPDDSRSSLYLAEIHLFEKDYDRNQALLDSVSKDHWLYQIEILVRKAALGEDIDIASIDEKTFPHDPIAKSNFYRLYSLFLEKSGEIEKADTFIEKAIHLNPNRHANFAVKLSLIEGRLFSSFEKNKNYNSDFTEFLSLIEEVEKDHFDFEELSARSQAALLLKKTKHISFTRKHTAL
jgi:tetratricopeptide (TPR) repeat protein